MVGSIFPTLYALWDGVHESFNDQYKSKLLFVDENPNADKHIQYVEIKKITGNKILRVNEKYTPAYYVPNNINLIIATNDPRPIFLKAREAPKAENINNFFIYRVPELDPSRINAELGQMLEDRLGHYVRTELKTRYERLVATRGTNNRYGIPAPFTPLARDLFAASQSTIEMEAEELARYIVCGVGTSLNDVMNGMQSYRPYTAPDGYQYVQLKDLRDLVRGMNFRGSANPKAYINALQDQEVLSFESDYRLNCQRLGFRVLRPASYYATTVSGQVESGAVTISGH